jgi:arylsulfatase A-like enzyme
MSSDRRKRILLNVGIAGLVGLLGGILAGTLDATRIILSIRPTPSLSELLGFWLPIEALYGIFGCLGMGAIGLIAGITMGPMKRNRLAGLYTGIFVTMVLSLRLSYTLKEVIRSMLRMGQITGNSIIIVTWILFVSLLSGLALGGFVAYLLERKIRGTALGVALASLFVTLMIFIHGATWFNLTLGERLLSPAGLCGGLILMILMPPLALGLYLLGISILERSRPAARRGRVIGVWLVGIIVVILILGGVVTVPSGATAKSPKNGPNILWIVIDTLRADHLSCYGYHRDTTPNIDRIAAEGVLFENAFTTAPWSLPSYASMLTGLYSSKHGADAEHIYLDERFDTVAEVLAKQGYRTFASCIGSRWANRLTNLDQGFEMFQNRRGGVLTLNNSELLINGILRMVRGFVGTMESAQETNAVVKKWISRCVKEGCPFFGFVLYLEPHFPYVIPEPYFSLWLGGQTINPKVKEALLNPYPYEYLRDNLKVTSQELEILKALYDGCISYVDFRVNQLVSYLKEEGILDNTLLIITSDHGENFGDHDLMSHCFSLHDTLIRVPLILRYPKVFPQGLRIKRQVQTVDIFPTILQILGIELEGLQGYSLLQDDRPRKFIIAEHQIFHLAITGIPRLSPSLYKLDLSKYARRLKCIRTDRFKYIWSSDGRDELYNIYKDPKESKNLIETCPEEARRLKKVLRDWLGSFRHYRQM